MEIPKKSPEQIAIEEIIDALKKIKDVEYKKKLAFAKHVILKAKAKRLLAADVAQSRDDTIDLVEKASAAHAALLAYCNVRYTTPKKGKKFSTALKHAALIGKEPDTSTIETVMKDLEAVSKAFSTRKPPATDATASRFIVGMVAKAFTEILGKKPTHNSQFQTDEDDKKVWGSADRGHPSPFDMVCLALHHYTGIKFSEKVLADARNFEKQRERGEEN